MNSHGIKNGKSDFAHKWLVLIVFLTNISQLPYFVDNGYTQYLTYLCWGSLLMVIIIRRKIILPKQSLMILGVSMWLILQLLIQTIVTSKDYFGARIFYCVFLSVFICLVTSFLPNYITKDLNAVYGAYFLGAFVVAVTVYMQYFRGQIDFFSPIYLYGSKNSTAQILLTGVVLTFFFESRYKLITIVKYIAMIFMISMLFIMRSRATLVGLVLLIFLLITSRQVSKRIRFIIIIFTVVFAWAVISNKEIYNTIVDGVLLAGRDADSLESVTSGRSVEWGTAASLIWESILWGKGSYKIESFPLSVLVQYGLLSGGLVILLSIYPLFFGIKNMKRGRDYYILVIVSGIYLLNGFFEELSPFGPGVKCYFLWMLLGILVARKR